MGKGHKVLLQTYIKIIVCSTNKINSIFLYTSAEIKKIYLSNQYSVFLLFLADFFLEGTLRFYSTIYLLRILGYEPLLKLEAKVLIYS